MKNIITVTFNPCIDLLMSVPSFTHGGMNRVKIIRRDPCGKGINVSAALKNLGAESLCTGFNYLGNAALIDGKLDRAGIPRDFVYADGNIRTNIKLTEKDTGTMTELNQPGEFIPPSKLKELVKKIAACVKSAEDETVLIISGSRPKGIGADVYSYLIQGLSECSTSGLRLSPAFNLTHNRHIKIFLDMEGEAFINAIHSSAPPYLVKPNLYELETAFGTKLSSHGEIKNLCRKELCGRGIEIVCVSMGGDGALLITSCEAWYAPALNIPVRGLAGAGDSMVAGFAMGISEGAPLKEAFRYAVAAASASVIREGTQMCLREDFEEMQKRAAVTPVPF